MMNVRWRGWVILLTLSVLVGLSVWYLSPTDNSSFQNTALKSTQTRELSQSSPVIKSKECRIGFKAMCRVAPMADPTGRVVKDSSAELAALRLYRRILHSKKGLSMEEIDELYVNKAYPESSRERLKKIFRWVKQNFLSLIENNLKHSLSSSHTKKLKKRIQSVILELPPPASLYDTDRDLFTRPVMLYQSNQNNPRIRVGGAYPIASLSFYNIVFSLAHELAHSIDPCELEMAELRTYFKTLSSCFLDLKWLPSNEHLQCGPSSHIAEVYADFWATQVLAQAIKRFASSYPPHQKWASVRNAVGDLCGLEDAQFELDFTKHPPPKIRVGNIFSGHPILVEFLACKRVKPYCTLSGEKIP